MHRCLQVYNVVVQIAGDLNGTCTGDSAGVAAMARTCAALYEPSMDVLWHTLPDMTPVFKCLPPSLWYEKDVKVPLDGEGDGTKHSLVSLHRVLDTRCT